MDKIFCTWYRNRQMKLLHMTHLLLIMSSAATALPDGVVQHQQPQHWEIEGIYVRAKALLEDPDNSNVTRVPVLLEACVQQNHPRALSLLLDVHEGKFKGLSAAPEAAFVLARKFAEEPNPQSDDEKAIQKEACYRLALYQEKGFGCKKDSTAAYEYMEKAAKLGLLKARVEQSRYLMRGIGHKKDAQRAWKLLHYVASLDPKTPNLFYYMGTICHEGIGHRPDYAKARKLFSMGAQMGDAKCLNNLAAMYERGQATRRSEELALLLYRKAATMGCKEASANMQRLAYKVGQKAEKATGRSAIDRIRNATNRVISALPFSSYTRSRIHAWLLGNDTEYEKQP